jgi:hypothetical protein
MLTKKIQQGLPVEIETTGSQARKVAGGTGGALNEAGHIGCTRKKKGESRLSAFPLYVERL